MGLESGMSSRTVNICILIDSSLSMAGERVNQVNLAMPEVIYELENLSKEKNVETMLRVITFNKDVHWKVGSVNAGVNVKDVVWKDLRSRVEVIEGLKAQGVDPKNIHWNDIADKVDIIGSTNTAGAINEIAKAMTVSNMGNKSYDPVIILMSDGNSDDPEETKKAIENIRYKLGHTDEGDKEVIIRVAIGIGESYNKEELCNFATKGTLNGVDDAPFFIGVENVDTLHNILREIAIASFFGSKSSDSDKKEFSYDDIDSIKW